MQINSTILAALALASSAFAINSVTMDVFNVGDCSSQNTIIPSITITDQGCVNIQNSIPSGYSFRDINLGPFCRLVWSTSLTCGTLDHAIDVNDFQCFSTRDIDPKIVERGGNALIFCSD